MQRPAFTRRGFLASGLAGLSLPALTQGATALAAPGIPPVQPLEQPPVQVILALPQSDALDRALTAAELSVRHSDTGAFLTDPARLRALAGQRVLLIGRDADLVLFDLALGDHAPGATVIHRANHRLPQGHLPLPASGWQAHDLSQVLAQGLNRPHSPLTWTGAPRAFSTLIADL
ncbi:hypothetical protein [Pseudodonghicola flavimaris]|uniref:Uncharacterized protein n=1 Tax=Pseudodonghicola flavimaris TaxID=3050036 RepID=A0ABT7F5Z9_9RHOB|nr:hypothetical protein [Pseudodonghicola flavimaris]MDK3019829.1 hypothetical protein [Pseudodonghicola flavimaris]